MAPEPLPALIQEVDPIQDWLGESLQKPGLFIHVNPVGAECEREKRVTLINEQNKVAVKQAIASLAYLKNFNIPAENLFKDSVTNCPELD